MSCYYFPVPTRAWSRVQAPCTSDRSDASEVYIPILKKTVPIGELYQELAMINKGNVLQYKQNSSNLTKKQRYAQIAKGLWVNRTTTYATQTETYSNPNTRSLKRVNYTNITTNGTPTNLPITCTPPTNPDSIVVVPDGGVLICNVAENICTGEVLSRTTQSFCAPTSASDVPGPVQTLCYNSGLFPTYYPKSVVVKRARDGNKFPQGYLKLVSALRD